MNGGGIMRSMWNVCWAIVGMAVLMPSFAVNAAEQQRGKMVVYDFEDGMPKEFRFSSSRGGRAEPSAELETHRGDTVLEL
ncbi:MAG: hypothetical protein KGZ25_14345, partial [Planctomycetes bacterium]|nr:hypothetical protein [Planctomycetota bacterium]